MTVYPIRLGRVAEVEYLREIEVMAGAIFTEYGMAASADDEPPDVEILALYCAEERLWVATDEHDLPIAYIIVDALDKSGHIEQVSVHPDYAGMRIGSALIDQALQWAAENGYESVTLTTFLEIPWNAPYYERLGFEIIPEQDWSPGLIRIRTEENTHGLDRWPRVCMRKRVATL